MLRLGHEVAMAGHMGIRKTTDRIQSNFFCPEMTEDISNFCKSCDVCQKTVPKGRIPKAPLDKMRHITEPFYRVSLDLIGPIQPVNL